MDRRRHFPALTAVTVTAALGLGACGHRTGKAGGAPAFGDADGAAARRNAATGDAGDRQAGAAPAPVHASRVFIANHGKLVGAFEGFAWVAAADGVRIDEPRLCDERGCFRGTDGMLCTRGAIPGKRCAGADSQACRRSAFGVKIGFDVRRDGAPWSASAHRYVSVEYRAAKRLRLAAHRSGDGDREYCVDSYPTGEFVDAARFRFDCGAGAAGEALASFEGVDKFTLEQPGADDVATFDYCITAIAVGDDADASAEGSPL